MNILEELAKEDQRWRKMAHYITGDKDEGDELVQEFYLKISSKNNFKIDPDYIFISLRNLWYDSQKKKMPLLEIVNLEDMPDDSQEYQAKEEMLTALEKAIHDTVKDGKTFQYIMGVLKLNYGLDRNFGTDFSMAQISELTGITKRKIQMSIEKARGILKEKLKEDYQDYIKSTQP